jgi:hypothetical protein
MRACALPLVLASLLSQFVHAQVTWQPTAPPLVTAETTGWFQSGEPIAWEGDFYYPAGAAQGFNSYQMVRSGSYRGIPLYTDTTLEPFSIVFVPIAGGRVQPYERRRSGVLAGTTGSRAPSFPTTIGIEGAIDSPIRQALAPPVYGTAYGIAEPVEPPAAATGTSGGSIPPAATGTLGYRAAPAGPVTTAIPPSGENAIWVEFNGQRWYAAGKSLAYDAAKLNEIGTYQGFTVYALRGDSAPGTIYIPSIPGHLSGYSKR